MKRTNRSLIYSFFAFCAFESPSVGKTLLDFEFNNPNNFGFQEGNLPAGNVFGKVSASKTYSGTADFGTDGSIVLPTFAHPKSSFTVESRFRLRSYGQPNDTFIRDILSSATWDNGRPTQGFQFHIGGGPLYPDFPDSAYSNLKDVQTSKVLYKTGGPEISKCIGELDMAQKESTRDWKEVFTDRCVELNTWTHMVSTWDGVKQRIFLNGHEVTDPWRNLGVNAHPNLDSITVLTVGALSPGGRQHFDGEIDFVRMHDYAMDIGQIQNQYRLTLPDTSKVGACGDKALPIFPTAGRLIREDTKFRVTLGAIFDFCLEIIFNGKNEVEVEFSPSPSFDSAVVRITISDTQFTIDGQIPKLSDLPNGACFWRTRRTAYRALAKSTEAGNQEWSAATPIMLDLGKMTELKQSPSNRKKLIFEKNSFIGYHFRSKLGSPPDIFDLNGNQIAAPLRSCDKGWCPDSKQVSPSGMYIFK